MGLFSGIMNKIFGHAEAKKPVAAAAAPAPAPLTLASEATASAAVPAPTAEVTPPPAPPVVVNVTAVLDELAAKNGEKLDWRRSIVDLMKLVGIDSSLSARKELAHELDYPGDTGDSAKMNVWLHRAVIKKLAENGGEVPADLLD
ncbi:MAG: DUF3597 domain-containing protein [Verrucomicrobiota bacterium]